MATAYLLINSGAPNPSRELTPQEENTVYAEIVHVRTHSKPISARPHGMGGIGVQIRDSYYIVRDGLLTIYEPGGGQTSYTDTVGLEAYLRECMREEIASAAAEPTVCLPCSEGMSAQEFLESLKDEAPMLTITIDKHGITRVFVGTGADREQVGVIGAFDLHRPCNGPFTNVDITFPPEDVIDVLEPDARARIDRHIATLQAIPFVTVRRA